MGVPAFFRWLSRKYPSVLIECLEERPVEVDGVRRPVDATEPNPNGVEFDNLYLDTNGIIHPCTHPEDKPAPKDEDEMMIAIFESIDRLFAIVRPRKLLYIAIDGPAPRAKMNQQRSRRFRAAKEAAEKVQAMARLREEMEEKGFYLPPEKEKGSHFDSNCITPGTPFMDRLSKCLQYYIHERINNEPAWKNIKVILSDSNAPGEGEHKIMEYVRRQRAQPDHDPNTQHVLMGGDADLIMLGIATHEVNFTIIREEFKPNKPKPCDLCRQVGHEMTDCLGVARPADGENFQGGEATFGEEDQYIFVRLSVLREYLKRDLAMDNLPFPYDFERVLDDWVFMCFFVGNDFLPHLPSLEIRENAIDRLVRLYKDNVRKTGGFLTNNGIVSPDRVKLIMQELGNVEDSIFKERQERELSFRARNKAKRRREQLERGNSDKWASQNAMVLNPLGSNTRPQNINAQDVKEMRRQSFHDSKSNNLEQPNNNERSRKRKSDEAQLDRNVFGTVSKDNDSDEEPSDEVRLWEGGCKDRYYESKFGVLPQETEFRYRVAAEYTYGLCWVLRYYYQGCPSWKWFYPYHYAPFASDFIKIESVKNEFEKNTGPFDPLEQLMCVFPAASRSHVPKPWGELMIDPESPIIDIYPTNFNIDLNGKKYAWQGVALLPFVDEGRMKQALKPLYSVLTVDETRRNTKGDDRLFMRKSHRAGDILNKICCEGSLNGEEEIKIDAKIFDGMAGSILPSKDCLQQGETFLSPVKGPKDVLNNQVFCLSYRNLQFDCDYIFFAGRLDGAKDPPTVLSARELSQTHSNEFRYRGNSRPSRFHGNRSYGAVPPPNASTPRGSNRNYGRSGFGSNSPYTGNVSGENRFQDSSLEGLNSTNRMDLMNILSQYAQIASSQNQLFPNMIPDLNSPGSLTTGLNRQESSPWQSFNASQGQGSPWQSFNTPQGQGSPWRNFNVPQGPGGSPNRGQSPNISRGRNNSPYANRGNGHRRSSNNFRGGYYTSK